MSRITKVRKYVLKILTRTKKQFYDEEGNKITPEEYLELLMKQKAEDMNAFLEKLKRKRKYEP